MLKGKNSCNDARWLGFYRRLNRSAALPDERELVSETPPNSSLWREGEISTEVNLRNCL
jgi:hypothetical protein